MKTKVKAIFPSCIGEYFKRIGEELEVFIEKDDMECLYYPNARICGILAEDSKVMDGLVFGREVDICKKEDHYVALVFGYMKDK